MKNSIKVYLGIIALLLAFSVNAWALPYPVSVGEKITMVVNSTPSAYAGDYQAINSSGIKFGVFCVEKGETFNSGGVYTVNNIEDYAENGGLGPNGKDYLDPVTKWLYSHFLSKDLYSLANITPSNDSALQNAIWFSENELTSISGNAKTLYELAKLHVSDSLAYDVKVMNLVDKSGNFAQSQLVGAPVPEPSTFLLLGAGLLGAGLLRRRSRK